MKKIYCISFAFKDDFDKATSISFDFYFGIDYENYFLEFDSHRNRKLFLDLLIEKDIEDIDIFESEKISY